MMLRIFYKSNIICLFIIMLIKMILTYWPPGCYVTKSSKCYVVHKEEMNFEDASDVCRTDGGKLARIQDAETNHLLFQHFIRTIHCSNHHLDHCLFWFGLKTTDPVKRTFSYLGDPNSNQSNFTYWAPNQPDSSSFLYGTTKPFSYCAGIDLITGRWSDENCLFDQHQFICEYESELCNVEKVYIPNAIYQNCHTSKSVAPGSVISVQCRDGFYLHGSPSVVCTGNGWSPFPSCIEICQLPEIQPHNALAVMLKTEHYFIGDQAIFLCSPGYVVENEPTRSHVIITCIKGGNWDRIPTKCDPINQLNLLSIAVNPVNSIALDCYVSNDVGDTPKDGSWFWQINSMDVSKLQDYAIDSNGTLSIETFTKENEGIYSCFSLQPKLLPGLISYDLKIEISCEGYDETVSQRVETEGVPLILRCPHPPSTYVKWLKDRVDISGSKRIVTVPDGSLFFYNVVFSDSGNYSCLIAKDNSPCKSILTTELKVKAAALNICGNKNTMETSPWTVSIWMEREKTPFCYGALIDEYWILTSAYCLFGLHRKKFSNIYVKCTKEIWLPETFWDEMDETSANVFNLIPVETMKIHPQYSQRLMVNDIALIKVRKPIYFSQSIQPICLSRIDFTDGGPCNEDMGLEGYTSGWGLLEKRSAIHLPETEFLPRIEMMKVENTKTCRETAAMQLSESVICATNLEGEDATYAADIGSPFVIESKGKVYLLGVFILGQRYSKIGKHDYFTKVSTYYPWIMSQI